MPQEDIRGIKDLIHIPYPPLVFILGAVIVLLILAGVVFALRSFLRKHPSHAPSAPPIPIPDQILNELAGLYAQLSETPESIKAFHFRLSEIFRRYLEFRFGFAATDSTTEEIVQQLPRVSQMSDTERDSILKILRGADEVKFADQKRSREESVLLGEQTEALVRNTQPSREGTA